MNQSQEKWYQQKKELRTTGQLVAGGGIAGAVMTILYVVIGIGIWSLVGYGLDHLFGTAWLAWAGAGLGACGGVYLVYLHMSQGQ